MATYYQITVQGHLDARWSAWFDGLTITNEPDGKAVLAGPIADQAALHGVLAKIRDLGLPLIAVQPVPAGSVDTRTEGSNASHVDYNGTSPS